MWALYKKEIFHFLSSLIGLVVIGVFLILCGLFTWVFGNNVFDNGVADLRAFFDAAPMVFLFLIPAVTMKSFSEEKRLRSLELLLTLPISDLKLVFSKYLAAFTLVVLSMLPTIVYYVSIYFMADPVGNVDGGAYWGSFIGMLFLGAGFTAIGIFASAITNNQIVSFLIAVLLSYVAWIGLDQLAMAVPSLEAVLFPLSMEQHYMQLAKGVLSSRDIIYFIALIGIFVLSTRLIIQSRNK